ncbi:ABC transporter permease [Mucilaginibacter terrenus]|uniref:ABC transporter permease n=1 Tax=Mucilaginibacter terrenus TaxID=2482727 RepID=A0A3E2NVI7_9SPHI|nr:ABC transporter permease [Mucilaginibacter terrenus]RFZ84931.1 ABC transporter permease [Mucilaginibacter terrenus]
MIKNYLKTAWRNLAQNRSTSIISVAGLAVGICCFMLLATYLINELRYDRFHEKADRIARLTSGYQSSDDPEPRVFAVTPTAPAIVLKQQIPGIEDAVRIFPYSNSSPSVIKLGDNLFKEKKVLVTDPSFFNIFDFKFIKGDRKTALNGSASAVLTASSAKKYFGSDDVVGKVVVLDGINLTVTGVIEDVPEYSQIKFNVLASYAIMPRSKNLKWNSSSDYSYFLLKQGTSIAKVQAQIDAFTKSRLKEEVRPGARQWYTLEPLTKVHLYSEAGYGIEPSGNVKYIYILGAVAIILLVLACVNFLNLVTARSAERAKEIGVRKVMGAQRKQLFFQFITEAGIITLTSLLIGLLMAGLAFPWFSNFSGQTLGFSTWNINWLVLAVTTLFILVTLLAGTYPSLYLSAFKPVVTLKSSSPGPAGGNALRKSLVVFQFIVSVFFIISTLIAGSQLQYIQHLNTGMNRSQVMVIDIGGMGYNELEAFKNEVAQQPGVKGATATYNSPINVTGGYSINSADGKNADFSLSVVAMPVEKTFISTMGIQLLQGRDLDLGDEQQVRIKEDSLRKYSFILNETAVKAMGWKPEQAIGKHIGLNGRMGIVKAVAKDFNFTSLHDKISPIVIFPEYSWFAKVLVKTDGRNTAATIAAVQAKWHTFYPNAPIEYHFLDQEFEEMYKADQRTGDILKAFTFVTIFISCLGLFGLAVFSTRLRLKEIGIRKVLGANVAGIVALISSDFLKLVLIAVVISSPLAYYAMTNWLQGFAYRINIQWWVFLLAGGLAIVIAFVTVGYQSIKAALANPIKSLRSE